MDWKDIAGKVGEWAPAIGAALAPATGGTSLLIGGAMGALTKALGLSPDAKPEDILNAFNTDPEARLKAQIAENEFLLKKRDQDIEEIKVYLGDVPNARDREVKIIQATGKRDYSQEALGWIITAGFFTVLVMRMFIRIPPDQLENVGMLIGALIVAFTTVVQYKYGSSKGSADKTAQINAMMEKKGV